MWYLYYADDFLFIIQAQDVEIAIDVLYETSKEFGLIISAKKSAILCIKNHVGLESFPDTLREIPIVT